MNYKMSLADMLIKCESVVKVSPVAIEMVTEEYFPIKGDGEVVMPVLERLWPKNGKPVRADWVRNMLKRKGLRPANLPEMILFAKNNPEKATEHSIVALSPVYIVPVGRFKTCYMYPQSFVPTIINHTRYHNGSRLERVGKPEIWLAPEYNIWSGNCSMEWHFAAVPIQIP